MSLDTSRFTFNPWNDYFGVLMQQGRVQLDSDWNEWLGQFARRIQAGTLDILGLAGVPSTTPYGFKINAYQDAVGTPHITIGTGRMYVDGLLVENHGPVALAQWDPALAEWSGAPPGSSEIDIDFINQPYLPGAMIQGNGPFLVYLDVWQREVTYLEDSNLVDKAVGVDTTERLQTVWQVKLLDVSSIPNGVTCSTPGSAIQSASVNWENQIQPPSCLLITGVVPTVSSGPCSLSPVVGYTGLENQLYRVEIHQGGSTSSNPMATFKWSREDASVTTLVIAISAATNSVGATASQLSVQSLGRDQILGFSPGDWIEILDDYLELNPPILNGQAEAGELHRIDSIDSAANTVTLDSQVSSVSFPINSANQTNPSRHTRIRRWDQSGTVYQSDGVTVWVDLDTTGNQGIPVPPPGTALILENGITVAFEGSSFQTGNFWSFAARTSDGSVEVFNQPASAQTQSLATAWDAATAYTPGQIVTSCGIYYVCLIANTGQAPPNPAFWTSQTPPLGIYHHYRRLGVVDFTAKPPKVSDCREVFPALANPSIHVAKILLAGNPLLNDSTVTVQALASGITVVCDLPIDPAIITQPMTLTQGASAWNATTAYTQGQVVTNAGNFYICLAPNTGKQPPNAALWAVAQFNCPVCFVSTDLPSPTIALTGGFTSQVLSATVSVNAFNINWTPTPTVVAALVSQISPGAPPLLARLKLKGNFIWARDNPNIHLNGAVSGAPNPVGGQQTSLQLPSGDGRRTADFDMWFWLVSQPTVTLSTNTVIFTAAQVVGSSVTPQSATITLTNNSTTTPLTFPATGISVTGADPNDFKVTNNCGTTVAPGASCVITVTFTPTAAGTRTAQININESADTNPLVITLTGTAIQPEVSASLNSLSFEAQVIGTTSARQTVTLTNPGTSQLTITNIASESSDFFMSTTCAGNLQPGQQCAIAVQFVPQPGPTGTRTTTLLIQTDAGNVVGGRLSISLTGIASPGNPAVTASATDFAFGAVDIVTSRSFTVTLTSSGTSALAITAIQISGVFAKSFDQTSNCTGSLQPGQQCTVTVTFSPSGTGLQNASLEIFTNAAGSPLIIGLSGVGVDKSGGGGGKLPHQVEKIRFITETSPVLRSSTTQPTPIETRDISSTKTPFISPQERPQAGPQP
jgi:hypothetical protein